MKRIFKLAQLTLALAALFTFGGCNNEAEISDISRITYFPIFQYEGGDFAVIPCSSDFQVPPITATEAGEELPLTVKIKGISGTVPSVDITKPDIYVETTTAVNSDGFPASVERTFWVACTGDLVNSIEGLYTSSVARNSTTPRYFDLEYILIRKVGANQYEVSDALGGWYEFGRALGSAYRTPGVIITANDIPSNSFSFTGPVEVGGFGGPATVASLTVDPVTKTLVMETDWVAPGGTMYHFISTMTQVAL